MKVKLSAVIIFIYTGLLFGQQDSVSADPETGLTFIFRGHVLVPLGDFASSNDGLAEVGFGIGGELEGYITRQFILFAGLDLYVNPVRDQTYSVPGIEVTFENSAYINIPIMLGVMYELNPGPAARIRLKGGLGINNYIPPNASIQIKDSKFSIDHVESFVFKLGAALVFDKLVIEMLYVNMGEPLITLLPEGGYSRSYTLSRKQVINVVCITLGIRI